MVNGHWAGGEGRLSNAELNAPPDGSVFQISRLFLAQLFSFKDTGDFCSSLNHFFDFFQCKMSGGGSTGRFETTEIGYECARSILAAFFLKSF